LTEDTRAPKTRQEEVEAAARGETEGAPDAVFDSTGTPVRDTPAQGAVAAASAIEAGAATYEASLWGDAWRDLRRNPLFVAASIFLVYFILVAAWPSPFTRWPVGLLGLAASTATVLLVTSKWASSLVHRRGRLLATVVCVAPLVVFLLYATTVQGQDPTDADLANSVDFEWFSFDHPFGFDIQGRDYYTRVVYGARVSVIIGLLVVGVDVVIALILGGIAGYYAGKSDAVISRTADVFFALPITLAGIVFLNVVGERGLLQVSAVLIFLGWPTLMRLMRSSVLSGKESDYVQAARALGANDLRIMRVHILPNGIAPVIVYATISVGIIISAEAALSFLGVGLQLPAISWGLMISDAQNRITTSPHLLAFPALYLSVVVLVFIILGDALRDALDPRLR
jgi:ABC-type dipeptide/oligopeptide/nickel transport system permease subunit